MEVAGNQIDFQVYCIAFFERAKIGISHGEGNERDRKLRFCDIDHGEAHAVDGDRAFFCNVWAKLLWECDCEAGAMTYFAGGDKARRRIDVSAYKMSVESFACFNARL